MVIIYISLSISIKVLNYSYYDLKQLTTIRFPLLALVMESWFPAWISMVPDFPWNELCINLLNRNVKIIICHEMNTNELTRRYQKCVESDSVWLCPRARRKTR